MFFILPGLQENYRININFLYYFNENKEKTLYSEEISGFGTIGNLAQVSWGGEYNNTKALLLQPTYTKCFVDYHSCGTKLIFDCSSPYINEINAYDMLGHAILKEASHYGDTEVVVRNNFAYNYFTQKYPEIFISKFPFYEDENDYDFHRYHCYISQLASCKANKNKTRIYLNRSCDLCSEDTQKECQNEENLNVALFSKNSCYISCPLRNKEIKNNISEFTDKGYTQFILPFYPADPLRQVEEYTKVLIKPEYSQEATKEILRRAGSQ